MTAHIALRLDDALARDIDALASVAAEPNPFHESWMLGPALEHLGAAAPTLACVRNASGTLTGLFPFRLTNRYRGLPLRSLRSWEHDYLFLGSPLIAAGDIAQTLSALLDWSASGAAPAAIIDFVSIRDDGPIGVALRAEIARREQLAAYAERRERALLVPARRDVAAVSGKHRKELRRQERRLGDLGDLSYRTLSADDDVTAWIERFLELEAAGWKGQSGTALAANPGSRAFFKDVCNEAHRRGRLQMIEMVLAGKTIATKCNFRSGDGAFMFKIAYDEAYAKYSPGLLLELAGMQSIASSTSGIAWVDSCAKTEHFMAERLWPERRVLADYSICGRGLLARAIIRHGERIRAIRHRLKGLLRGA